MTIIVGVVSGSSVTIGADRRRSAGSIAIPTNEPKIWRQGSIVFGLTGSDRESQLIRHGTQWPAKAANDDLLRWLTIDVVDAIRRGRAKHGHEEKASNGTEASPTALLAVEGRLFGLYSDYQILEFKEYAAIGSGEQFAFGSLSTTSGMKWSGRKRVLAALESAARHDIYCAKPFDLMMSRGRDE